ncbi:hypothetical protein BCV69DRAFT_283953 [Microstroma glucosiphilum]|uniref:Transmembrane protein n=1 Tax=Pseudomicrostroma glucosiphilum TaxID=1684307 RepID=A0A316U3H9_9BASI|nr:hypothetical protein BCV69DRAFT_283953 [Pseudomicrostroma glucosiphilum]PWN19849.1 hypothetical protein BCV69DRAFT_283953 [Pseudomicrostroma glucosiphilum]
MRCSQLVVFLFLLIHSVASLPTPPPGLLPSVWRSQSESGHQNPTSAVEAQAPANSHGSGNLQSARSIVLQVGRRFVTSPRLHDTNDASEANAPLLSRSPARPERAPANWKKPLVGIGIIGTVLTAIGGLASYKAWLKERDRRRKKEQQQAGKPKAQPPGVQHPVVQAPQDGPWCMGC